MKRKTRFAVLALITGVAAFVCACSPLENLANQRAEGMYQEIQAMAADRSSSSDSECGVAILHGCLEDGTALIYSRATVDEALLLEKVAQYNEFEDWLNEGNAYCGFEHGAMLMGAISVNGVCVAGGR